MFFQFYPLWHSHTATRKQIIYFKFAFGFEKSLTICIGIRALVSRFACKVVLNNNEAVKNKRGAELLRFY